MRVSKLIKTKKVPSFILPPLPDLSHEAELQRQGHQFVAGVDEAGRGPLAGPVVAGAVVLPTAFAHEFFGELNDSKQLTEAVRDKLCESIQTEAAWGLGIVTHTEIDEMNIRRASWEAMRRAVVDLTGRFPNQAPSFILADGLAVREMEWPWPYEALVKGDARSRSIAAASIIAKVTRDAIMAEMDVEFPGYGFAKHKGYPTAAHYTAISELGACEIHRRTFRLFAKG